MKIIDIHTHGIGGYDTRTDFADHILKIADIQGSYGVSRILPTIYPSTVRVMRENMEIVKEAMKLQDAGYMIHDIGQMSPSSPFEKRDEGGFEKEGEDRGACEPAEIAGVHLEGPFLNPAKCGALNAMTFLKPSEYNFRELVEGFEDMIKIITIAPELDGATELIRIISDAYGKLLGGGMTVAECARSLIKMGYDEGAIIKCVTENPDMYLGTK